MEEIEKLGESSDYLRCDIGPYVFIVPILGVEEVVSTEHIITVPEGASAIDGIMTLRGQTVPILNLRAILAIPATESETQRQQVIIIRSSGFFVGCLVDSISGLTTVQDSQIEQTGVELPRGILSEFLLGVATVDDALYLILDFDRILDLEGENITKIGEQKSRT